MNQQLPRLVALFVAGGVILIGARHYLIPPTFGATGHYRGDAVKLVTARARKFAGQAMCAECHPDVANKRSAGNHRGLACETCHGPAGKHTESPDSTPQIPQPRQFCPVCHAYDPSRPTGFPQIDPVTHNPLIKCTNCHDPHAPVPPVTPNECRACHGQIARAKEMSKHAQLPCTTCHNAPEQHKHTPHSVRPTKPATRDFCVQCHAQADTLKQHGAPQIDVASHHERYVCWDCHYPHNPKAQ